MSKEAIEKVINSYFTNLAAMNPPAWLENFAEDAITYDPVGKPANPVHENSQKFFGLLSNFFAKMEITQNYVAIAENQAAVKWTMEVLAKNGKTAQAEGISVFQFNEAGKIQSLSAFWDDDGMMAKLR
jgi:steroid delta-isomerase